MLPNLQGDPEIEPSLFQAGQIVAPPQQKKIKKETKPRNPDFYTLKYCFWIIIVVKSWVFHISNYKKHLIAYKKPCYGIITVIKP